MPQMSAFTRLAEDFTAHWLNTASVAGLYGNVGQAN